MTKDQDQLRNLLFFKSSKILIKGRQRRQSKAGNEAHSSEYGPIIVASRADSQLWAIFTAEDFPTKCFKFLLADFICIFVRLLCFRAKIVNY